MFYVYVLQRVDNPSEIYIGYTADLKRRVGEHQKEHKSFTGERGAWTLIYYEAYCAEEDARNREIKLKQYGSAKHQLKARLKKSLKH